MSDPRTLSVPPEAAGQRLDIFIAAAIEGISRSRVQLLIYQDGVRVDGKAEKASFKLRGLETIEVLADPHPAPLHAKPEDIPLDVVYEDKDMAVINKPAGMMVHAGSGSTDDARSGGTLVNALLHRFKSLSSTGGDLRPGIVHRLDKLTSGLIVVAKNDRAHMALGAMFSERKVKKTYIALVHGLVERARGTVSAAIDRDPIRRTRMAINPAGRSAVTHYDVVERISTRFGHFTLVHVSIETGRTHQIRVHMASIGHPVVGDTLYGASGSLVEQDQAGQLRRPANPERIRLDRNFLHAARLEFAQPITAKPLILEAPLPPELQSLLERLRPTPPAAPPVAKPAAKPPAKPAAKRAAKPAAKPRQKK
jgi:23S rRNA pseudouridine1911/1915/1917 synthase